MPGNLLRRANSDSSESDQFTPSRRNVIDREQLHRGRQYLALHAGEEAIPRNEHRSLRVDGPSLDEKRGRVALPIRPGGQLVSQLMKKSVSAMEGSQALIKFTQRSAITLKDKKG